MEMGLKEGNNHFDKYIQTCTDDYHMAYGVQTLWLKFYIGCYEKKLYQAVRKRNWTSSILVEWRLNLEQIKGSVYINFKLWRPKFNIDYNEEIC